jgi:Ca2+-binding RTX toxin-like protein
MVVGTMVVFEGGHLQIGSEANPVQAGVMAELVIADQALDLEFDPEQFGTGLLGFGKVEMHGEAKSETWLRLAEEPRAGDTVLVLENAVTGWHEGDTLIIPDTRQVPSTLNSKVLGGQSVFEGQWEEITIDRIEGNRIYLSDPLTFDHLGGRNADGEVEFLPHVGLLNRNIVIRSENPEGTRGHVLFANRADVDIKYARFHELGRTDAFQNLDNTTYDENGNVDHIGTNQIARYALHFHHVIGPENPTNEGYQFEIVGNTIDGALKWGTVIHGTSFGLIEQNIGYDIQGAAFVTEDGSEIGNRFIENFAMKVIGTGKDGKSGLNTNPDLNDYGRGGVGFWSRRAGDIWIGNVAANTLYAGQMINGYYTFDVTIPAYRGAMPMMEGQGLDPLTTPAGMLCGNEYYGRIQTGLWIAYPTGVYDSIRVEESGLLVGNTNIWNTTLNAVEIWHTNGITFDNLTLLGDVDNLKQGKHNPNRGSFGFNFEQYENDNIIVRNSRIEGFYAGVMGTWSDQGGEIGGAPTIYQDSYFNNYIDIGIPSSAQVEEQSNPNRGKGTEIRNVVFGDLDIATLPGDPPSNIAMIVRSGNQVDMMALDVVKVYDYNGVKGDNFQVFYYEQHPDYIPPETGTSWHMTGSPEAGLTNQQLWNKYGVAVGGALAPSVDSQSSNAQDRPEIHGLVFALPSVALTGPTEVDAGETAVFTLDGGSDPVPGNHTFDIDWDGDGQVDQVIVGPLGTQVSHAFTSPGRTDVRVAVTDPNGDTLLVNHTVEVVGDEVSLSIAAPNSGILGQPQTFTFLADGAGSESLNFDIDWDGDGNIDQTVSGVGSASVSHAFSTLGHHQVTVQASDSSGTVRGMASHSIQIGTQVLKLKVAGPSETTAGDQEHFSLSSTSTLINPNEVFDFQIDWDGDGSVDQVVTGTATSNLMHTFDTAGNFTVAVSAIDQHGTLRSTATLAILVNEVPVEDPEDPVEDPEDPVEDPEDPVEDPEDPVDPVEGQIDTQIMASSAGAMGEEIGFILMKDNGVDGTFQFKVDWDGDGQVDETFPAEFNTTGLEGTLVTHAFSQAGDYQVKVQLVDSAGTVHGESTHAVTVVGQHGSAAVVAQRQVVRNNATSVSLNANGQWGNSGETLTYEIDWDGDGSVDQVVTAKGALELEHVFEDLGVKTVHVSARNSSGTLRGEARHDLLVSDMGRIDGNLVYSGSEMADFFGAVEIDSDAMLAFAIDGEQNAFSFQYFDGITGTVVADGRGGNDLLNAALANRGVVLRGGAGNDILTGSLKDDLLDGGDGDDILNGLAGADILVGGDGEDRLEGGDGNDLLLAGRGADIVLGGKGEDILISGHTSFDDDFDALWSIHQEWTAQREYGFRVLNLLGVTNTGENDGKVLRPALTVFDDGDGDILLGGLDLDWVFIDSDDDKADDLEKNELSMLV